MNTSPQSLQNINDGTTIGFIFGDNDPGDEFLVDLYFDEKYGQSSSKLCSVYPNVELSLLTWKKIKTTRD